MDFRNRLPRFTDNDFLPRTPKLGNDGDVNITRVDIRGDKVEIGLEAPEDFPRELAKPHQTDKNFLLDKKNLFRLMGLEHDDEKQFFNLKMTQARQGQFPLFKDLNLLGQTEAVDEAELTQEISFLDQEYIKELAEFFLRIEASDDQSLAKHAQDLFEFALVYEKPELANAIRNLVPNQKLSSEKLDIWNEVEARQNKEQAMQDLTEMLQERQGFISKDSVTKIADQYEIQEQADSLSANTKLSPKLLVEMAELNEREAEVFEYFKQGWILGKASGSPALDSDKVVLLKKEFDQEDLMFINSLAKKAVEIDESDDPLLKDYAQSFLKFGIKLNRLKFANKIFDAMPGFDFKRFD